MLKIVNYQNCQKTVLSQLEKVGGHRYPPGSLKGFAFQSDLSVGPITSCSPSIYDTCTFLGSSSSLSSSVML
jgi:hypothetical protein